MASPPPSGSPSSSRSGEKIAVLFEPYQRAVATTTSSIGSIGLGLYIVKKIIDAHHGRITVVSNEEGTTFSVTRPRTSAGQLLAR